jgi:pimeloyl-ACP methyl ester carboxylesterase
MSQRRAVLVVLALLAAVVTSVPAHSDPPVALEDTFAPTEPTARDFPADFLPRLPLDAQEQRASVRDWKDPHVGGWGGSLAGGASCQGWYRQHRAAAPPVVFVHGNTSDAEFWRGSDSGDGTTEDVRARFLAAGYSPCQLWAISYDGASGSYFTYDDINVAEVYAFLTGVRAYLEAPSVDVVSHSLGVTIVRKAGLLHPQIYGWMSSFVGLAGANHGTTTCRGRGAGGTADSNVCLETEPGSSWLAALNAGPHGDGEAPPGPRYLTVYDGSGLADDFYLGPDAQSPALAGRAVCNHQMPLTAHNSFAISRTAIDYYLGFLHTGACPS